MNETMVTLTGWVGSDVTMREAGEVEVAEFRVATTPRRYQRRTDSWVDGDTQWYTVKAWRQLGRNCQASLRRGDPVVLHGRLNAQTWTNSAGIAVTSFDLEATFVGHDLTLGTGVFTRVAKEAPSGLQPAAQSAEGPDEAETEADAA